MDACRNDGGIVFTPYGGYVIALFTKDLSTICTITTMIPRGLGEGK